jgi:hypothetical protein
LALAQNQGTLSSSVFAFYAHSAEKAKNKVGKVPLC